MVRHEENTRLVVDLDTSAIPRQLKDTQQSVNTGSSGGGTGVASITGTPPQASVSAFENSLRYYMPSIIRVMGMSNVASAIQPVSSGAINALSQASKGGLGIAGGAVAGIGIGAAAIGVALGAAAYAADKFTGVMNSITSSFQRYNAITLAAAVRFEVLTLQMHFRLAAALEPAISAWIQLKTQVLGAILAQAPQINSLARILANFIGSIMPTVVGAVSAVSDIFKMFWFNIKAAWDILKLITLPLQMLWAALKGFSSWFMHTFFPGIVWSFESFLRGVVIVLDALAKYDPTGVLADMSKSFSAAADAAHKFANGMAASTNALTMAQRSFQYQFQDSISHALFMQEGHGPEGGMTRINPDVKKAPPAGGIPKPENFNPYIKSLPKTPDGKVSLPQSDFPKVAVNVSQVYQQNIQHDQAVQDAVYQVRTELVRALDTARNETRLRAAAVEGLFIAASM